MPEPERHAGSAAVAAEAERQRRRSVALARKVGFGVVGGVVLVAGIVMLIGPGPGPLVIVLGLFILSQEFAWAARRLDQAKEKALAAAHKTAASPTSVGVALVGAAALVGGGVYWGLNDDLPLSSWLTAGTVIASGLIGAGTVLWAIGDLKKQEK